MLSNFKKGFAVLIVMLLCLTMSSCAPDQGLFDDLDIYKDAFDEVTLMRQDLEFNNYDFYPDLFYEEVTEEFIPAMDMGQYSYMFIESEMDFRIEEIYFYLLGETDDALAIDVAVVGAIPPNLRKYDDPKTHIEEIDGEEVEVETVYDEFPFSGTTTGLISTKWESAGIRFAEPLNVNSGDFLVFRFKNNTAYGKDDGLNAITFQITGFFIRAIE